MSQENVEVVRKPLRVREGSSRSFDQRLALRLPRLTLAYARMIDRLPPQSRIRQTAVWRGVRDAVEAWNRRDIDAFMIAYRPDCEHYPPREFVEAGLWESCYRGRAGYIRLMASWTDAGADARIEPVELVDLGTRLVLLSEMATRMPRMAGVPLTRDYASVFTPRDGRLIRVDEYTDHAQALEAVGLRE